MKDHVLHEQIEYYRARAQEYDQSISSAESIMSLGRSLLLKMGQFDQILELACGTGIWTETLLMMGKAVTALDAAPEMLEIARKKLGVERIKYQQADLFEWEPVDKYDLVFFANWLSHVPPIAVDEFLGKVQRSLGPGGEIGIVDQYAPSPDDNLIAEEQIYAKRPLEDGRQFTIVKAFYGVEHVQGKLEKMGFEVSINKFSEPFYFLQGKRID